MTKLMKYLIPYLLFAILAPINDNPCNSSSCNNSMHSYCNKERISTIYESAE